VRTGITLEQYIELLHTPPAAPQQASGIDIQSIHLRVCQDWRSTIIFLISAIALAGFRSFGHTSVQFMMV
jgi:hypothetical protein